MAAEVMGPTGSHPNQEAAQRVPCGGAHARKSDTFSPPRPAPARDRAWCGTSVKHRALLSRMEARRLHTRLCRNLCYLSLARLRGPSPFQDLQDPRCEDRAFNTEATSVVSARHSSFTATLSQSQPRLHLVGVARDVQSCRSLHTDARITRSTLTAADSVHCRPTYRPPDPTQRLS